MKGYHYTSLKNYQKIKEEGLLPSPLTEDNILIASRDEIGIWLFCMPQEGGSLFGMLVDRFARHGQLWEMVELEVDFEIEDCLQAVNKENALIIKHTGTMENWVYHEDELTFIIKKKIPPCQIQLRRQFNLFPRESDLKLIDDLLVLSKDDTWENMEQDSYIIRDAMARLRQAWTDGEMETITLSLANYFAKK